MFEKNINETNYGRHLSSCKFGGTKGTPIITSYFQKIQNRKKICISSPDVPVESTSYTSDVCILHSEDPVSPTNSTATDIPTNLLVEEKCEGISIKIQSGSFYSKDSHSSS